MTKMRRLLAVGAFVGLAAIISSSLQGQSGKKTAGSATTPQFTPARQVSQLAESAESRFSAPGVLTYQPLKGDAYFALSIQPKLEKQADRPRDIVIMMSTTATQGGTGFIASNQIAEGIIAGARENDRVSLWTANEPKKTVELTKGFLLAKDFADSRLLKDALEKYRKNEYPSGTTDLKHAISAAVQSFESSKDRQRIFLFLGDGMSAFNPLTDADRNELAKSMVARQIAFFPVPLGIRLDPHMLHGLANSTGGMVLRTTIEEEKLVDALKRYEQAFAGPVLYKASIQLPAEMKDVCPSELPPLRADSPTLVVGRMKAIPKQIDYTINGVPAGGKSASIKATEAVLAHNLDNYFLVGMIDQWAKASKYPAILRADRVLATTYEQTRLEHQNCLETAQMALEEYKLDAAHRMFEQARNIAPHDGQAVAGIKIVDRLKDGSLTKADLRKKFEQRSGKADELKVVDGKPRWTRGVDLAVLLQEEKLPAGGKKPGEPIKEPGIAPEDLLKEHRNRLVVEEQKIANMVDDAIRMGRRNLPNDPDGTLDLLRSLFNRVNDHPDLSAGMRDALTNRLQAALSISAAEAKSIKLKKLEITQAAATATAAIIKDQERKSFEDRVDAQFRVFRNLMNQARYEENTKMEILQAMVAIKDDARLYGQRVPVSAKAMYDIAIAALPLQTHNTLVRRREQNWLSLMMGIERAHIPYPDEPYIHFPPLATWKALIKARKDKYEVSSLPDDEAGRKEAAEIYRLLQQTIETKGLHEKVKLRTALEYFSDKFAGKLPILVDREAFQADLGADAPDPYEQEVSLPPVPSKMVMNTALRLILSQVGNGEATYLIRRSFVEITTSKRYLEDKVIRIYPVGDLAMPINGGAQGGGSLTGGFGMQGMGGMGMGGMPMGGMGMAGMGFDPTMGGGMGMGGMGMAGMGMGMGGMPMGGMGMGGFPMGGMGMGGMPMGGMGMAGMGMGMAGMAGMGMGMGGTAYTGAGGGGIGGFTGSFNGSLGAVGATQASGLIDIITRIVDPGNWNRPPTTPPLMMGMVGFPGFMGFGGMFMGFGGGGMMMGGAMMVGAGPPPDPTIVPPDPTTSNSIDFFPPALAIIVRAPSRMHTSITGGIVGGRSKRLEAAARLEFEGKGGGALVRGAKDPNVKVAPGMDVAKKQPEKLDPLKVWNDAFVKGGVTAGHVVATADFLFESGHYKHAAEFLKANLRHGVVVRPWVFEALAVALESSGADPEEVRRARLSGIALDPDDAQGFLSAARAMADRGQHERAIAFCRQAAQLEPNDFHPYEVALAYAETAKDPVAMEWAVGKLVSQDWPVDNLMIQTNAKKRLGSLVTTLKTDNRGTDAEKLEAALQRLNQRDLIVQLVWDNAGSPSELTMKIKEPAGNVCTLDQKQTTGGGILIGYNLTDKDPNCQYIVSEAFQGDYEITVSRVFGQPLNNRARLIVTQNAGTPKQSRRIEIIKLDQNAPVKITLKEGRRTELASVSPAAEQRREVAKTEKERSAFHDLRAVANPNFYGTSGPRGSAGTPGMMPSALAARDSKTKAPATPIMQNAINSKNGLPMTAQVRLSGDQSTVDVVIRPFFDMISSRQNRAAINLSAVPGGQ